VASVKQEFDLPEVAIRPMHELDVPVVVTVERSAYQFPWSEGIFRDCLRVGYVCRVVEVGIDIAGYGIMSMGAGEAHVLNVCVREEYRGRGLARKVLLYLLDRARNAGMLASNRSGCGAATTRPPTAGKTPRYCGASWPPRSSPDTVSVARFGVPPRHTLYYAAADWPASLRRRQVPRTYDQRIS
jgi:GNAT superfamily N-acetyltransferase